MVEILNFSPDKTSVGRGMEVTYTLDIVNRGPTAGVLTATFSEISSDGQRIQRDVRVRTVGSGGTTTFEFTLNVSASPGHVYTVCVDVVKTPRDSGVVVGTDSECDSSVVVSEGSGIIVIESCTVNKTRVDGGATIRYTTRITNRLWAQKVVFLNLWDIDTGESLYTGYLQLLPDESTTFEYPMQCTELGKTYRVCARILDDYGAHDTEIESVCAPRVEVSNVWGTPDMKLVDVTARCPVSGIGNRDGFGITAFVRNDGSAAGTPWVRITPTNLDTGEEYPDHGGTCAYVEEGTRVKFEIFTVPPDTGSYSVDVYIPGTDQHKTLNVSVVDGVVCDAGGNGSGGIGPGGRSHGIPVEAIAFVGSIAVGALAIYLLGDKEAWAWE